MEFLCLGPRGIHPLRSTAFFTPKNRKPRAVNFSPQKSPTTGTPDFRAENDVMRVWVLRVFVICGFLCFFENVSCFEERV